MIPRTILTGKHSVLLISPSFLCYKAKDQLERLIFCFFSESIYRRSLNQSLAIDFLTPLNILIFGKGGIWGMDSTPTFGYLIKCIHHRLHAEAARHFSDIDLTPAQAHILIVLHHAVDETARMKELERDFHCAQSTMAGLVNRLEKKRLVASFTLSEDRRIKCVRLTDEGRALCDRSRASIASAEAAMLSGLSNAEKEQAYALLEKMYASISSSVN